MLRCKMLAGSAVAVAVMWTAFATAIPSARATDAEDAAKYNCDRECLRQIADLYFEALAQHKPSLLPLSPNVKYAETGTVLKPGEGLWKNAGAPAYRLEIFDPQTGGIGIDAVVPDGSVPTIVGLRLKVENHLITEMESILVRGDDPSVFHAPEKLVQPSRYFTRKLRPAEQNSRFELMAAADAYFRAFQTEGTPDYIRAPLLPDTLRFENGLQATNIDLKVHKATTAAEQFDNAMFKGTKVYDRRYPVVDTDAGVVMALVRFHSNQAAPPPGSAPARGDAFVCEFFAVTQGKIMEIQATWIQPKEQLPTPF
ncbi:MAG TPA: hypothetical protein VEJ46_01460 [Candidatus Acidoferrum sp.]|nr:hypothetical protein [Candidatus Acidoferrum sp.]